METLLHSSVLCIIVQSMIYGNFTSQLSIIQSMPYGNLTSQLRIVYYCTKYGLWKVYLIAQYCKSMAYGNFTAQLSIVYYSTNYTLQLSIVYYSTNYTLCTLYLIAEYCVSQYKLYPMYTLPHSSVLCIIVQTISYGHSTSQLSIVYYSTNYTLWTLYFIAEYCVLQYTLYPMDTLPHS